MLAMSPWEIVIPTVAALGLPSWAAMYPRSQLFGATLCRTGNACALTFDDGPNPRVTAKLLTLLEKYRVPATFFVLGRYVKQHPQLAAEIRAANHAIGNHTYGHPSLLFRSEPSYLERRCAVQEMPALSLLMMDRILESQRSCSRCWKNTGYPRRSSFLAGTLNSTRNSLRKFAPPITLLGIIRTDIPACSSDLNPVIWSDVVPYRKCLRSHF